ncbi:hypothetical protein GCM10022206_79320 [Streptomyces chiangmaiensis]
MHDVGAMTFEARAKVPKAVEPTAPAPEGFLPRPARHRRFTRETAIAMAVVTTGLIGLCIAVILGSAAGAA